MRVPRSAEGCARRAKELDAEQVRRSLSILVGSRPIARASPGRVGAARRTRPRQKALVRHAPALADSLVADLRRAGHLDAALVANPAVEEALARSLTERAWARLVSLQDTPRDDPSPVGYAHEEAGWACEALRAWDEVRGPLPDGLLRSLIRYGFREGSPAFTPPGTGRVSLGYRAWQTFTDLQHVPEPLLWSLFAAPPLDPRSDAAACLLGHAAWTSDLALRALRLAGDASERASVALSLSRRRAMVADRAVCEALLAADDWAVTCQVLERLEALEAPGRWRDGFRRLVRQSTRAARSLLVCLTAPATQWLDRSLLAPLLRAEDARVREAAVAALGRIGAAR